MWQGQTTSTTPLTIWRFRKICRLFEREFLFYCYLSSTSLSLFPSKGSNADPYKFEIPEFDESEFNFGPEDHKKLVKKVGIHDEPKQTSNTKSTRK